MLQALLYRVACALFHQPRLLRAVAKWLRRFPALSSTLGVAAGADAVRTMLADENRFSHGHYPAVMPGGPFLIGLPSGPVHATKRQCLHGLLPSTDALAAASAKALEDIVKKLKAMRGRSQTFDFDLIDDYMAPLVWNAMRLTYDANAEQVDKMDPELLQAARWHGAQLLIGSVATDLVRQRAIRSAVTLNAMFSDNQSGALHEFSFDARWKTAIPKRTEMLRDAVGLMWVGHPSVTQAGALMMQELLDHPDVHAELVDQVRMLGGQPANIPPSHRAQLREHVLELLRFRPPFPLLGRLLPEDAALPGPPASDGARGTEIRLACGARVAMILGALFDPAAQREDPQCYVPGRTFWQPEDRMLMFGAGPRHCIAGEQVVEVLVTALHGLLCLGLDPWRLRAGRCTFDGPVIVHMPMTNQR